MSSKQPTIANVMESLKNIESVLSSGQKPSLSTEEAAAYLGITVKSLQTLTHKKQIPYYKPNGKMLYFDRGELDEWKDSLPAANGMGRMH